MQKRSKVLIGLATAGCFSAGFGAAILPASAEQQTLTVTLLGGQTIQVTVDVPPGTPLDQLTIPGVTTPIVGISTGAPAAAPSDAAPAATGTTDGTSGASGATDAAPQASDKPTADGGGKKQRRTGHKVKKGATGATGATGAAGKATGVVKKEIGGSADAPGDTSAPVRAPDGTPTVADPTLSVSLPGAAAIGVPNFFIEKFRIPPFLLPIYQAAGIQYGIRWEILAAINEIETDYGRNLSVSSAGALGWMQFLPSTFKQYGVDANDDGRKDPYNPVDAIFTAARYLKAAGGDKDVRKSIFAYNHADWYVDSVLMRARLIGGLPSDLVGSLSGLTEGHFPVAAPAKYADDVSTADAEQRFARGHNAARPDESSAARQSIDIFAKAGSPVVAAQDAHVVEIGHSARLGRFIVVRDTYGNTYTYGGLKSVADSYPVPKPHPESKQQVAAQLSLPAKDPSPSGPATAGSQKRTPAKAAAGAKVVKSVATPATTATAPTVRKERLFAEPDDKLSYAHGGQEQILNADTSEADFKGYFSELTGLKRKDVTIKPLKVGANVLAGTTLGRIGALSKTVAPHMKFEIRPAGRGAPRIDPKPILDGWKLLESTSIYRAAGKNPFFGPGAKTPTVGQILLESKEGLQRQLLADPNVELSTAGRGDVRTGQIDRRVLATIEFLSASGLRPTITCLKSCHGDRGSATNTSEHATGNAVDIAKINGIPVLGHQGTGSITDLTIRRLLTLQGTLKPQQIISTMTFDGADNTLSLPDHADHIQIGFTPLYDPNTKAGKHLDAVLKPSQWIKLIGRLGEIQNPTVLTTPSQAAIKDSPAELKAQSAGG